MNETHDADLLMSFFEYRALFQRPIFSALSSSEPLAALFQAFKEWGVALSDVSSNPSPVNAAEYQTTIELLNRKYAFSAGLGSVRLSVTNPYWEEAKQIAQIATAGLNAIISSTGAEVNQQIVQLGMHLKPQNSSIKEVTSRFISPGVIPIVESDILACGFSLYSENCTWVIDRSALDRSALFISLSRVFDSITSFESIASILGKEQQQAMEALRLKIV